MKISRIVICLRELAVDLKVSKGSVFTGKLTMSNQIEHIFSNHQQTLQWKELEVIEFYISTYFSSYIIVLSA